MKDPLIGMQLANFRVERLLGQGGMASVYYGEDVKLHRPVAIKVLDKRYKNHPAYATRFVNEARMMAKWRHENIIQIYYADDAQGFPYYVMEFVDGQDLAAIMLMYQEEGRLMPMDDVLRIGNAVAGALDYAHRQGVIHRDVKPSNILISKDGRVLLGDFGMALEVRDGSQGNVFGTPHYISPEQARRSADAVPQSDIYSFGVILYEILTGAVPFNDPSPASIALQHISQPPPPPRSINPDLSPEVEAVLLKAMDKDQHSRYQSGVKLMRALEDSLKADGSPKKITLPPLPVGVPTIRRSDVSVDQLAKREGAGVKIKAAQQAQGAPATVRANPPSRKRAFWAFGILVILLLLIGGFFYARGGFNAPILLPTSTLVSALPTSTKPVPAIETDTQPPPSIPSQTPTLAPPTETATPTFNPPVIVSSEPTVKYPEGNQFSLFYNETSFFMLNRSFAHRSISGFSFQRLDKDGLPLEDMFEGYRWETRKFNYLPRNFCVNITIYGDQEPPYLTPADCFAGLINTVQPRFDRPDGLLFWTPTTDSDRFRVMWLGEEVARCLFADGACDVFIP